MARDLAQDPLWREEDLGYAIPDSIHGVSVALPHWAHVVGYEEKDPAIIARMHCGYPRFYCHPYLQELFAVGEARFCESGEKALVYPSRTAAERCLEYVSARTGAGGRVADFGAHGLFAAILPEGGLEAGLKFWQHCGQITSSRLAEAALKKPGAAVVSAEEGNEARKLLRMRLAGWSGQRPEDVFLFQTGMAGVFAVHRALTRLYPDKKCVQVEFPYVDVLKIQEQIGAGVHFVTPDEDGGLGKSEALLGNEPLSGVYCELPSNPLLRSVDIGRLREILAPRGVPLIVDDTIGSVFNIDVFRDADVVTSSLTKYISGSGDVMGGAVILRSDSPVRDAFAECFEAEAPDSLWRGDAVVLEKNSRDYEERIAKINATGEALFTYLDAHPKVAATWYPRNRTAALYGKVRRDAGGEGGLLSILLKDAESASAPFYDALRISKGPSLGTNFSLVCPYTLLAHYGELKWAESFGVSRHLIRISVGLEEFEDLRGRFEDAFAAC